MLVVAASLILVGIVYFISRSGSSDEARQSAADPKRAADVAPTVAAPEAPKNIASQPRPAMHAEDSAPRPSPRWQASLQPSVVAATRVDSLSAYQVQMEKWNCEGERCVGNLRIPLNTDAGRRHDMSASADILHVLQKKMAESDVQVAVRSIQPDSLGIAVSLEFSPNASSQGRFYTDEEIASIRMESIQQGARMNCKDPSH